jgi:hypothetical protein
MFQPTAVSHSGASVCLRLRFATTAPSLIRREDMHVQPAASGRNASSGARTGNRIRKSQSTPTKAMRAQCCQLSPKPAMIGFVISTRIRPAAKSCSRLLFRIEVIRSAHFDGAGDRSAQGVAFGVQIAPDNPRLGISVDDACAGFDALCNRLTACRAAFHQRLRLVHEQRAMASQSPS